MIPLRLASVTDAARFWRRVDKTNECWVWKGERSTGSGYGRFWFGGQKVKAHRVAWIITHLADPGMLHVLHKCDNPPCVRPEHLFLGTQKDNAQDMSRKGRARNVPHRGSANGFAKLDELKAFRIRRQHAEGISMAELAREFSVSIATIYNIVRYLAWKHAA